MNSFFFCCPNLSAFREVDADKDMSCIFEVKQPRRWRKGRLGVSAVYPGLSIIRKHKVLDLRVTVILINKAHLFTAVLNTMVLLVNTCMSPRAAIKTIAMGIIIGNRRDAMGGFFKGEGEEEEDGIKGNV